MKKLDKSAVKRVIKELSRKEREINVILSTAQEVMASAKTVNEVMCAKRNLLGSWITAMPLNVDSCYFCVAYDFDCNKCPYKKTHGDCTCDRDGSYQKIQHAQDTLRDMVEELYWKGGK